MSRSGGVAARLTSHPADEAFPAISPDGATLAFSAAYEGPTEVYTMPLAGGSPVRRTFDGGGARVVGFAPDGALVYSTRRFSTLPDTQLFRLDLRTGARAAVPLAQAADGDWTPDGRTLFFTRLPFQGSHTKRYRGGTAQSLWKYATGAAEAVPLTGDYAGTSKTPMWWSGRVYFLSDRDGTMNVWSMDEEGHDLRQHTKHKGWDADQASLSDGRIVYKLGADLRLLDLASGVDKALDVRLSSDFDQEREAWVKKPLDYLTSIALSPKGDRVALTARGQVFVAPAKLGRLVEVTRAAGVRYRRATFLPDGKGLVALSDESGEVELWRLPANGVGQPEQLTRDAKVLRWEAVPSPDGKWIAHHDKDRQLWLWSVEKKTSTLLGTSRAGDFQDLAWSRDSRWLAYSVPAPNTFNQVFLYRIEGGTTTAVTSDRFDSGSPAWSADGEWLYFLSDRNLKTLVRAPWGPRQPDPFLARPTEIYAVALKKDGRFPFQPPDELHPEEPKKDEAKKEEGGKTETSAKAADKPAAKEKDKDQAKAEAPPKPVVIDLEGLSARLYKVPVPAGRLGSLQTDGKRLYWLSVDDSPEQKRKLQALAIGREKPDVKTVMDGVAEFQISADDKKLLVRKEKENDLYVFDAGDKAPEKLDESKLDLSRWSFSFDPREQWRQMFVEAWRLERDYFYDRGMHGLDWPKVREKYEPLVARVKSRGELSDLLAQMVSELSALHIFVRGGDLRKGSDDVEVGSLGAELARDEAAGGWRVARIYAADPDVPQSLSPPPRRRRDRGRRSDRVGERCRHPPGDRPVGTPAQPGRPPGPPAREAEGGRGAGRDRRADDDAGRREPAVRRLGVRAAAPRRGAGQGPDRLRAPQGDGRRQLRGVGAGLLPGLPAQGADPRRAAQPRREHRQLDPREAPPQGLVLLAGPRGGPVLEHAVRLPGPHGRARRPVDGVRRRGLRGGLPPAGSRQGHRHPHVGRRDLALQQQRPRRQRHRHRGRERRLRA